MSARSWLSILGVALALCQSAWAEEWKLYRYEGRDYVSLENLAAFYAFPPPPLLDSAANPPPPTPPLGPVNAAHEQEEPSASDLDLSPALPADAKKIILDNGHNRIVVVPNSRLAEINGVIQWLDFPVIVQEGRLLLSRLDLSKTVEPRLRPEKIEGLKPVTTVVLDPGHGGHDHGAASNFGFEKDFALDVALRARDLLEKRGFKVVMTRSADIFIPLHERPAVANHLADSVFVSIHFNSATSNSNARGFEIYSCAPRGAPSTNDGAFTARDLREEPANAVDVQNTVLSGAIFHSLLGHVPFPDRGIKHARFAVLRLCTQPSVLVECGFVSNTSDRTLIASPSWRAQVAESIADGIENYKELAEQHVAPKMVADYRRAAGGVSPAAPQ